MIPRLAILLLIVVCTTHAQDTNDIRLSGSIGLSFDSYTMTSTGPTETFARRPATVARFSADPTISVGDWLSIPIVVSCTFREAAVIQPSFNYPDVSSFLQNPMNRFSISPKLGWLQFNIGSIVPKYGTLTVDNAQLFGASVDASPGILRASVAYGTLFRAVPADTTTGRIGSYARTLWAVRLGSHTESQSIVGLTVAYMNDDESSIPYISREASIPVPIVDSTGVVVRDSLFSFTERNPLLGKPQEGAALGIDFKAGIGDNFHIGGELAAAAFTRDKSAPLLEDPTPVFNDILTMHTSTRYDFAGKFDIGYRDEFWGLTAGVIYVGPGFVALTQPFFQPDRIDISVSPNIRLLEGKLSATATVGYRINDVSHMLTGGSTQFLLSVNGMGVVSESFTIGGSYTNFGYRTTRMDDTLRYEQVSNSISFMPSYIIVTDDHRHVLTATVSNDVFSDVTSGAVQSSANTTTAYGFMYGISPKVATWSARVSVNMVSNNLPTTSIDMKSGTLSGSIRALNGLFEPDAAVTYSLNNIGGLPQETQVTIRAGCRSRIITSINIFVNAQWTSVSSEDPSSGRAYKELLATVGARWSF